MYTYANAYVYTIFHILYIWNHMDMYIYIYVYYTVCMQYIMTDHLRTGSCWEPGFGNQAHPPRRSNTRRSRRSNLFAVAVQLRPTGGA